MKNLIKYICIIAIICITTIISYNSSAQPKAGIKGGLNLSNMTGDTNDRNLLTGFHLGGWVEAPVSKSFSIQPELLFTQKGLKKEYVNGDFTADTKLRLNYIELPVNFVYNLSKDFSFEAGPYFDYLISAKLETTSANNIGEFEFLRELNRNDFNQFDLGFGFGLRYFLNPVYIGLNYKAGFVKVAGDNNYTEDFLENSKNNTIQVFAGIAF